MSRAERRRQQKLAEKSAKRTRRGTSTRLSPGVQPLTIEQQTVTVEQALSQAMQHHGAGRLPQAESIYKKILSADRNQSVALHLLGVVAYQGGHLDASVDLITRALAIAPGYAEAHTNLGLALQGLGNLDRAVANHH